MKARLLILFFFLAATTGWSQITVTEGGILSITPTVSFYAAGDFINNGKVLNNGSLFIAGAWTNTGDYEEESGQVTFNGAAQQVINHNAQSFAKLVISGGGQKVFDADIHVTDVLSLENGILITNNHSKIILSETATITNGGPTSFVQGAVYTTGTGSRFFPVGINATYLPVTFSEIAGTSPVVGVEVFQSNPDHLLSANLAAVSSQWYWQVSTLSGTFAGSSVSLPLSGESFTNQDKIVVVQAKTLSDPFESLGATSFSGTAASGTVISKDLASLPILATGEEKVDTDHTVVVYNAVTPGSDGQNDFLKIKNIEFYPDNRVIIVNRWGDKVFELSGYNNTDRIFNGEGNAGGTKALTDGTYYYIVDKGNGDDKLSGFLILKR